MKKSVVAIALTMNLLLASCGQLGQPAVELKSFTNEALGFRGVAPVGWVEVIPGQFAGGEWPNKQLLHEVYGGADLNTVIAAAVLPRLQVEELPAATGSVESDGIYWDLFAIELPDPNLGTIVVDLAMAETEEGVYLVALISTQDDHEQQRQSVFIPAVEAFDLVPIEERTRVTAAELMSTDHEGDGPDSTVSYMPTAESGPAVHELEGTLTVPEFRMYDMIPDNQDLRPSLGYFPGFSVDFFTYEGYLVPVEREVILPPENRSSWSIILSPGETWSEVEDGGMSRASFPFVLVAEDTNEAHNGVAMFLYDEASVSSLRLQITQETAAWRRLDYWGQYALEYTPHALGDKPGLEAQFVEELDHQMPIRPWSDLEASYDPQELEAFNGIILPTDVSASGLVLDGTIYLQPCLTRYGPFPYCGSMRHGAFSVTKSMGAAVAMLRLAQVYGEEVFDLKIADFVEVTADHNGWQEVTFADALNMATGIGDDLPTREEPNVMLADEEGDEPIFNAFMEARSAQEKADICFTAGNYPWGPGEVARYNSCHTFTLSMAMDSYLKSKQGSEADIWGMVLDEVYRPIGIYHAPMMRSIEPEGARGVPLFWVGLYPTVEDVAKVAMLLRDGGQHLGEQLLHAGRLAEALRMTEVAGLPTGEFNDDGEGRYHMTFWSMPYRSSEGHLYQIPYMSGFGGNRVVFNPNGIIAFQFADAHVYGFESMVRVAEGMEPFPAP